MLRKTLTVAGTRSGWRVSGSPEGIAEILTFATARRPLNFKGNFLRKSWSQKSDFHDRLLRQFRGLSRCHHGNASADHYTTGRSIYAAHDGRRPKQHASAPG